MTIAQVEDNLQELIENFSKDTFIFDLLFAYGFPKASIKRLESGDLNQLGTKGELTIRKQLFFKIESADKLHFSIEQLSQDPKVLKNHPRFIVVTDYEKLLAIDTKTKDTLDINFLELSKCYDFFLPWIGMEKAQYKSENPADVKAAEKMAKLYDAIVQDNEIKTKEDIHALNIFLTRLLFCFFAEDTNILEKNQFTHAIQSHTQNDGSDLAEYLERLFEVFNLKVRDEALPNYLKAFPYVNGGLFKDKYAIPTFSMKSRNLMIETGSLNWSEINPDIFGSMIQAVVTPEHRSGLGMHYTSVPNIMKVIEPLFLDELKEEFENAKHNVSKLNALHVRLSKIKIFDPACGSGNFLIIAYKELRKLEIKVLKALHQSSSSKQLDFGFTASVKKEQQSLLFFLSEIKLSQFYGIELDDFAHEVALLSLWLAEHQMNMEFFKELGQTNPPLPLKDGGNIVCGNATRVNWEEVCPKNEDDEIYILGNPPYLGARLQDVQQKQDMASVFKGIKNFNNLDYIACWFYKGAQYIQSSNAKVAFVSTNSISQGEQVGILWPHILDKGIDIDFAYKSFKWQNNAKANAAVIVVIIGLRNISSKLKYLYTDNIKHEVKNINTYLVNAENIIVLKRSKPLSKLKPMSFGSMANDEGNLFFTEDEFNKLKNENNPAVKYIRPAINGADFLRGNSKYCLWISDKEKDEALKNDIIRDRVCKVKVIRENSVREATQKLSLIPYKFAEIRHKETQSIVAPTTSSERREYIPAGFLTSNTIIANATNAIYNAEPWIFGIISSKIHMTWIKAVAGRLKTDYRYSSALVYNTFPFPNITQKQKDEIAELVFHILDEREKHSQKTLAQLYDPDKMPEGLKKTHQNLDFAIERCYRSKPFANDEERLEYLFKMYEEMTSKEVKK